MNAILKYNLPEENKEFENAINAQKMHIVLLKMDQWLRGTIKHAPDSMSKDTYEAFKKCREVLNELMNAENLSFND